MRVYDFIQFLKSVGAWDGVAGSCAYWNTRADYETVYAYILAHDPERKYGYLARTANTLSDKRLGGGGKYFFDRDNVRKIVEAMEETILV